MANKKETRAKLESTAKALFDNNRGINTLHLCANGQGYTDKERAAEYASQFDDDSVYTFERAGNPEAKAKEEAEKKAAAKAEAEKKAKAEAEKKAKAEAELAKQQKAFDYDNLDRELLEDREFLLARYEALEGKKAPGTIKSETLIEKVKVLEIERFGAEKK